MGLSVKWARAGPTQVAGSERDLLCARVQPGQLCAAFALRQDAGRGAATAASSLVAMQPHDLLIQSVYSCLRSRVAQCCKDAGSISYQRVYVAEVVNAAGGRVRPSL